MENLLWVAAGGLLGWMSYEYLGFNAARGLLASIAIGVVGALVGANTLAPMFISSGAPLDTSSVPYLLFAAGTAAACLVLGNLVYRRWNF